MKYIAHTKNGKDFVSEEESQSLEEHLKNVSRLAAEFSKKFGAEEVGRALGLYHDYGKYSAAFQKRIRGKKLSAPHAIYGAKLFCDTKNWLLEFSGLAIACHHSGLLDFGTAADIGGNTYHGKINACEDFGKISAEIFEDKISVDKIKHKNLNVTEKSVSFALSFYLRMLFSSLVDADYTDTGEFCTGEKRISEITSFGKMIESLEENRPKNGLGELNKIRGEIYDRCVQYADKPKGFYTLTVPTGGGKTISSLAYGLYHAKKHELDRIIYVIPFKSIIEQNADVISNLVGAENVLEHHSDMIYDDKAPRKKQAAENWDMPVIVTTNVQFLETLFSRRPAKCRKLHNITNSVIIVDEVQSIPREYISPILYAFNELIANYGCTVLFMSATQPFIKDYSLSVPFEIMKNPVALSEQLKRVKYSFIGEKSDDELMELIEGYASSLIIVNSRKYAFSLYQKASKSRNAVLLTTLITPEERSEKITQIKKSLKKNENITVVSTQLIEAGVDVDFPVVFRAVAGLDSIIQSGGRANREGKLEFGEVFVFNPTSEEGRVPRSLKKSAGKGQEVLYALGDKAFEIEGTQKYFELLYHSEAVDGLLDSKNILEEFDYHAKRFNFEAVSERFKIIDDTGYSVIIPASEKALALLELVKENLYKKETIRALSKYTVGIYEKEFRDLCSKGVISEANGFYFLNNMNFYNKEIGLDIFSEENKNAESYFL